MTKKLNLSDEQNVRELVLSGVKKCSDLAGMTLGPDGRSVLIERGAGAEPLIVDDGRRVMENIQLDNPVEQLVSRVLYEITRKTDEKVGDGTTTSLILAHAILKEVITNRLSSGGIVGNQESVSGLDRELSEAKQKVFELLDKEKKEVTTEQDLIDVAKVSSGDNKLGEIIGKMYWELGKNGHITMEFNFNSEEIETSVQPGFRFSGGWAKRFMISNALRQESVAVDSHLLITEKRDIDVESVKGLCAEVQNSGKNGLTIIAPK